ncbi:MAG: hypothetical protein IKD72_08920 [Clostridia bacterium]|nr:hypothetical protein [Clostridia bacterium]
MKLKQWIAALTVCLMVIGIVRVPAAAAPSLDMLTVETDGCDYRILDADGNEVDLTAGGSARKGPRRAPANLPAAYDARQAGVVTPVKSQGNTGCCWAFSAIAALESDAIAQGLAGQNADFSEAHLAWFANRSLVTDEADPTHGDGVSHENPYLSGGNWAVSTAALARWSGINTEASYPFTGQNGYAEADRYGSDSGLVVQSVEQLNDTTAIKQWILQHGAVTASFYYSPAYETLVQNQVNGQLVPYTSSYYCPDKQTTNHQVTIIGWDDTYSSTFYYDPAPTANGAWLVKDSWGTDNHTDGYLWISYQDAGLGDFYGMTVRPRATGDRNYTYNGAYYTSVTTFDGDCRLANVFRAQSEELLQAAAFNTMIPDQQVTVEVYKLRNSDSTPVRGTPLCTQTLTLANAGYHTVALPTVVALSAGDRFSVVVTYKAQAVPSLGSTCAVVPLERNVDGGSVAYAAAAKTSYFYLNGWREASACGSGICNVYVQAITACSHSFSDWHDAESAAPGQHTQQRACIHCGLTESRTVSTGAKVVTLNQLLEMIFAGWKRMLTNLMKK